MRYLLASVAGCLLVLAFLGTVGYQPANAADLPQRDPDSELVRAMVEGCAAGLGLARVEVQGGVVVVTCRPNLGVHPVRR